MIRHTQDRVGDKGTCQKTAVACILDLPVEEVPDFVNLHLDGDGHWLYPFLEWLRPMGLYYTEFPVQGHGEEFTEFWQQQKPYLGYHLLIGPSATFEGLTHVVVGFNGEMMWDTNPSRKGLTHVENVGLFIATDPALVASADRGTE